MEHKKIKFLRNKNDQTYFSDPNERYKKCCTS